MASGIESKAGKPGGLRFLGIRLRRVRAQKGFTQQELAERSGIPGSHISRIENGHRLPSLETLERLAGGLQLPLYDLLSPAENSPRPYTRAVQQDVAKIIAKARRDGTGLEKFLVSLGGVLPRLTEVDCALILSVARKMAAIKQAGRPPETKS